MLGTVEIHVINKFPGVGSWRYISDFTELFIVSGS